MKAPDSYILEDVVRFHEVGADLEVKASSLLNYLQEAASRHSERAGDSFAKQLEEGLVWVLRRLHLLVNSPLKWADPIRIETWSVSIERYTAVRDFRIESEGRVCGAATTQWVLLDVERRRPVRIQDVYERGYGRRAVREIDDPFAPLPSFEAPDHSRLVTIRRGDLNRLHLSNAVAAEACLESLPPEIVDSRRLASLEVAYRKEGFYGDDLRSESVAFEGTGESQVFLHRTRRVSDGEITTQARSMWRRVGSTQR